MIIVSNTSPIINFAIVGQLSLLQQIYGKVVIPEAVYREIVIEGAGQVGAEEVDKLDWIEVKQITDHPMATSLQTNLDIGEAEAIVLAVELKADLLLLDERQGRMIANRLGLNYIGILGVLIRAKREDLIPAVKPIVDDLMTKAGFWISEKLYDYILKTADESE